MQLKKCGEAGEDAGTKERGIYAASTGIIFWRLEARLDVRKSKRRERRAPRAM
jgi:hypothetical protein